jgi:hypothetical protein
MYAFLLICAEISANPELAGEVAKYRADPFDFSMYSARLQEGAERLEKIEAEQTRQTEAEAEQTRLTEIKAHEAEAQRVGGQQATRPEPHTIIRTRGPRSGIVRTTLDPGDGDPDPDHDPVGEAIERLLDVAPPFSLGQVALLGRILGGAR